MEKITTSMILNNKLAFLRLLASLVVMTATFFWQRRRGLVLLLLLLLMSTAPYMIVAYAAMKGQLMIGLAATAVLGVVFHITADARDKAFASFSPLYQRALDKRALRNAGSSK